MTTLELKLTLSEETLQYLQTEAERRDVSLDVIVAEVIEDYFDEPTDEKILDGIREGMLDALAGRVRPAHEVLDELMREMGEDDHTG